MRISPPGAAENFIAAMRRANGSRRCRLSLSMVVLALPVAVLVSGCAVSVPLAVSFSQSASTVEAYDFIEATAHVLGLPGGNPFTDASMQGWFETADGRQRWNVEGFSDSDSGTDFRIRFMPSAAGDYKYSVQYRQGSFARNFAGTFRATDGHRRGILRVDTQHPWHFVWEGTGEHYFFNGTTAYWLIGWQDEEVIKSSITRLAGLKVNRMRVTIAGRTNTFFGEPVMVERNWTTFITPWRARKPRAPKTLTIPDQWSCAEHLLNRVRDQGDRGHQRGDGQRREQRLPPVAGQQAAVVGRDVPAPVRRGRLDAEAEEGQRDQREDPGDDVRGLVGGAGRRQALEVSEHGRRRTVAVYAAGP